MSVNDDRIPMSASDECRSDADTLVLINQLRAVRGEPPLRAEDFDRFDALMSDPDGGPLTL